jgi:hypothetical protein
MNKTIHKLLDELSFLSRETVGASFTIQHNKETGKWKVVFGNAMAARAKLKDTEFEDALKQAIDWLRNERKPLTAPQEKFTLFSYYNS